MSTNSYSIRNIFSRHKLKISLTFLLLVSENAFKVIQPFVLGLAINDLLKQKFDGLYLFSRLYLISFLIGVVRRYYDTRVYTYIYAQLATEVVDDQFKEEVSISKISARSGLLKELIDFFEQDITQGFSAIIKVVGAMVMLFIFNHWIFLACIGTIVLVVLLYSISGSTILKYNIQLNDEYEKRLDVLETRHTPKVQNHFNSLGKWMVKLSNLETLNFGIIELLLLALSIFTLYISAGVPNILAGTIFSTMTYILEFAEGVFMLPFLYQQFIRLKEISSRLKTIS